MPTYVARMVVDVKIAADVDDDARSLLRSTGEWEDWEIVEIQRLADTTNADRWPYTPRSINPTFPLFDSGDPSLADDVSKKFGQGE